MVTQLKMSLKSNARKTISIIVGIDIEETPKSWYNVSKDKKLTK